MSLQTIIKIGNYYSIKYGRRTDLDYIAIINIIKDAMNVGAPYFVDITNEVTDGKGMIYKVYEFRTSPDKLNELIEFNELYITIINPNKDKDFRYAGKKAEINPNNEMILFPNPSDFKKIKQSPGSALSYLINDLKFEKVIEHELTHQVNKLKANNEIYRSFGGSAQFNPEKLEYINSTEEIQARLIPIVKSIQDAVIASKGKMGEILRAAIASNDFVSFKNYIFGFYFQDLHLDAVNENTKKRYIKRLYEVFTHLKEDL